MPGRIVADERGVSFAGQLLVPHTEIKSGLLLPRPDGALVVRFRRKGLHLPVDLRVADREEGRALLRALGLDASQSVATFRLLSNAFFDAAKRRRWGMYWGVGVAVFAMVIGFVARTAPHLAGILPLGFALLTLGAALMAAIPTRLQVGADGLHMKWLRRQRFIAYGDVDRTDPFEDPGSGKSQTAGLLVTLKGGETVRLPGDEQARHGARDDLSSCTSGSARPSRPGAAVRAWRTRPSSGAPAARRRSGSARCGGSGAFANADARTARHAGEAVAHQVEDPAAPADARAGAAVALGQTADEDARARLRAAASATAAPKLRFAIETAAKKQTDEALAAALAKVESEEPRSPQRA